MDQLHHEDALRREQAARALGLLGLQARSAVPALLAAFSDPLGRVRSMAAWAAVAIEPDETALPLLIDGLQSDNVDRRFRSARVLVAVRPTPIKAMSALLERLRYEEEYGVVDFVCWALQRIGSASVPPLAEMLRSGDARLRRRAARALMWGSAERIAQALRPLMDALDDGDRLVRATAPQSLGENARAWRKAHGALDQSWDSVAEAVGRVLSEPGDGPRSQAAKTLWQLGDKAELVTDRLVVALGDGQEETRR